MDAERVKRACSETLVLSLLAGGPMHGYDMCKEIESRSAGFFALKHSTLYPLLHRLEKERLVRAKWAQLDSGKPRRVYELTAKGRAYHEEGVASWRDLIASMTRIVPELAR